MITPAISVLGAVEGLEVAAPALKPFVVPITLRRSCSALFMVQRHGTARSASCSGRSCCVWFLVLAVLGVCAHRDRPGGPAALDPHHARASSSRALGARVRRRSARSCSCVTGAEALYADMGHFGKRPIRLAWFCLVMPALVLNYFGQGALLLADPSAVGNPFYLLAPAGRCIPLVVLATCGAVIASQAVISGAFSVTQQAIQLGYLPRMRDHAHLGATRPARSTCRWSTGAARLHRRSRWSASARRDRLAARLRHRRHRRHADHYDR